MKISDMQDIGYATPVLKGSFKGVMTLRLGITTLGALIPEVALETICHPLAYKHRYRGTDSAIRHSL